MQVQYVNNGRVQKKILASRVIAFWDNCSVNSCASPDKRSNSLYALANMRLYEDEINNVGNEFNNNMTYTPI